MGRNEVRVGEAVPPVTTVSRLAAALIAGTVLAGSGPALAQFRVGGLVPVGAEDVAAIDAALDEMRSAGWTAEEMDIRLRREGYVLDRAVLDGDVAVADGRVRGMVAEVAGAGDPAGGDPAGGDGRAPNRQPTPFERGLAGVAGNVGNTDEEILRAMQGGNSQLWARMTGILSGRSVTNRANQVIDGATGAATRPIREAGDAAVNTVMQPIEDTVDTAAQSAMCSLGSAALGAAASLVSAVFSGGKATYGAQVAQWLTGISSQVCLGQQLAVQKRMVALQQRMVAPIGRNVVGQAGGVSGVVLDSIGLLDAEEVARGYQDGASADLAPGASLAMQRLLRARTDQARRAALETAALNVAAERAYSDMADRALDLSQSARGQTSAVQALAQLQRANEGAAAARHSSQMAFSNAALVAEEEDRASERLAAARRARFYSGLGPSGSQEAAAPGFNLFQ
jgi:hypothetical protein